MDAQHRLVTPPVMAAADAAEGDRAVAAAVASRLLDDARVKVAKQSTDTYYRSPNHRPLTFQAAAVVARRTHRERGRWPELPGAAVQYSTSHVHPSPSMAVGRGPAHGER